MENNIITTHYIIEDREILINKILSYAAIVKRDGMLAIEEIQEREKNSFLSYVMLMLVNNDNSEYIEKLSLTYIKYYQLDVEKSETIKRQMSMILETALYVRNEHSLVSISDLCHCFYPASTLQHI